MPPRKKRAAAKAPNAVPPVEAPVISDVGEAQATPAPARGMTTEQIRRVANRIAEHERDLKSSTSRR